MDEKKDFTAQELQSTNTFTGRINGIKFSAVAFATSALKNQLHPLWGEF